MLISVDNFISGGMGSPMSPSVGEGSFLMMCVKIARDLTSRAI